MPVRLIAKGGMGAVYEVEHARTGERLALKVLLSSVGSSAEELERFKREARAPARIKSEHVVRVTDADVAPELGGAPFLVMELLDGADLEREAAASPPPPATVIEWLRQVARTLDKAHGLGIVHRDLKPQNLFLARSESRAPIVKILDFGIVKMTEESAGGTGSGQLLGTPKYMSPEQASAKGRVTPAADRYSLGLVAYRLLIGESYHSGDVLNILARLLHDPLEAPSQRHAGFGSAFDAWFLKACHRDPEARFTSAAEQIEALSAALGLPGIEIQTAHEPIREGPTHRARRMIVATVLVTAGLAAVSLVGVILKRRPTTGGSGAIPPAVVSTGSSEPRPMAPTTTPPPPTTTAAPPPPRTPAAENKSVPVTPAVDAGRSRTRHRRPPGTEPAAANTSGTEKPSAPDPYADQH
jgi:serine/threonine protein kinase